MTTTNDYYCNQKFWWLTVNLEKNNAGSCCNAKQQKINFNWLESNPGQLFNSPDFVSDRTQMLDNQPVESCRVACWQIEQQGKASRRLVQQGGTPTHTNINSGVEVLHIITGSDCNLTCAYCCKYYSSAWTRDVMVKPYAVSTSDDRYQASAVDKILQNISQKQLSESFLQQKLISELQQLYKSPTLKQVDITGGEPFLFLKLSEIVSNIPSNIKVNVWSGLGVDETRFAKELDKLPPNICVVVSAENIHELYELARFGNSWQRFESNLNLLVKKGISYSFNSTVTNLTLPGLSDFVKYAGSIPVYFSLCTDPDFLSPEVLDQKTKDNLDLSLLPEFVKSALHMNPTPEKISNFKSYIKEFAQRRNIKLSSLPSTMTEWIMS